MAITVLAKPAAGQALPRASDGKPAFSGIWQALNTANWNILAHAAGALEVLVQVPKIRVSGISRAGICGVLMVSFASRDSSMGRVKMLPSRR